MFFQRLVSSDVHSIVFFSSNKLCTANKLKGKKFIGFVWRNSQEHREQPRLKPDTPIDTTWYLGTYQVHLVRLKHLVHTYEHGHVKKRFSPRGTNTQNQPQPPNNTKKQNFQPSSKATTTTQATAMMLIVLTTLLSGLFTLAYWLGILDRPRFERKEFVSESKREFYALLATSTTTTNASEYCDLLTASKKAMDTHPKCDEILSQGAESYGAPKGSSYTGLCVYLDEVATSYDGANWGCGFLIDGKHLDEVKQIVENTATGTDSKITTPRPIKILKMGKGPVLWGRIIWRNKFSPIIAKYLHWSRAFDVWGDEADAVGFEVYIVGPGDSFEYIDYLLIDSKSTSPVNVTPATMAQEAQ